MTNCSCYQAFKFSSSYRFPYVGIGNGRSSGDPGGQLIGLGDIGNSKTTTSTVTNTAIPDTSSDTETPIVTAPKAQPTVRQKKSSYHGGESIPLLKKFQSLPVKKLGGGGWGRLKGLGGGGGGGGGGSQESPAASSTAIPEPSPKKEATSSSSSTAGEGAAKKTRDGSGSDQQYKEIMKNMAEFKVDMKQEIGRMNQKVRKEI